MFLDPAITVAYATAQAHHHALNSLFPLNFHGPFNAAGDLMCMSFFWHHILHSKSMLSALELDLNKLFLLVKFLVQCTLSVLYTFFPH
jgi:hypothetical protein